MKNPHGNAIFFPPTPRPFAHFLLHIYANIVISPYMPPTHLDILQMKRIYDEESPDEGFDDHEPPKTLKQPKVKTTPSLQNIKMLLELHGDGLAQRKPSFPDSFGSHPLFVRLWSGDLATSCSVGILLL